ncbi:MAG: SDR family NAD(P)-dependent oxidoreductase [Caulobacteraceae bacterium]
MRLADRIAIVTGAGGGGCGREIAHSLARVGATVIVSDIDEAGGLQTVRTIEAAGGRASFLRADVRREAEVKALIAHAEETYGGLDILVNDASGPGYHPEAPLDYWFETVETDLLGAMYGVRHAIDAMMKRGGGAILNMGSTSALAHGRVHSGGAPAYDVAKAGVMRLTTTLSWLKDKMNIRVNCLVPDFVASPDVKGYFDSLRPEQRGRDGIPETLTTLEEIANAALGLLRDDALAGRVLVYWTGRKPGLIAFGDPGYVTLEDWPMPPPPG